MIVNLMLTLVLGLLHTAISLQKKIHIIIVSDVIDLSITTMRESYCIKILKCIPIIMNKTYSANFLLLFAAVAITALSVDF